jgi:predicted MPP superfamily phosphohydrolase
MLLLHLSDIHFREPDCENPDLDPERPIRTVMLRDARQRIQTLGPVDAILVGGDIAYKGHKQEYVAAFNWLKELAEATGCCLERVFVVPGNHDVDRSITAGQTSVRNAQAAIARALTNDRDRELRAQLNDPHTGQALFASVAEYNEFAKLFNCQIYSPDRLYWKQELPLKDGVRLRIFGLTSILLSGINGQNDTRESLYLSPLQTVLDPVDDVINLVISHHPPDWFMDQDDVDDAIRSRAAIHIFGHKHRQRIYKDDSYVRFGAAAVNPDRNETGWQPGYNLININVVGEGLSRSLEINAHLLQWQSNPDMFRPALTSQREPVNYHKIPIPTHNPTVSENSYQNILVEPMLGSESREDVVDVEAAMGNESTRNLVFRFWNLTVSQRREITLRLGLIEQDEISLPEPERYGRALMRAGERDMLLQLADEINKVETH